MATSTMSTSQNRRSSPAPGSHIPTLSAPSGSSTSTVAAERPASLAALPSIRSLRKAFQFPSSSNRHHSVDGYAVAANADFRRSTGSSRTISGSLPRPTASFARSSSSNGVAQSSSVDSVNASSSPGAPASVPVSASNPSPAEGSSTSDGLGGGLRGLPDNATHLREMPARPLSGQAIPEHNAVIYSSSIPVNSRPASNSNSAKSSPPETGEAKLQPSLAPMHEAMDAFADVSSSQTQSKDMLDPEEDDLPLPVMHITRFKSSTPPPAIPLPPVPEIIEHASLSKAEMPTLRFTKEVDPTLRVNTPHISEASSAQEEASASILDERGPEALGTADGLSINNSPYPDRPTVARSRSAIDTIRTIAEEADILNSSKIDGTGTSSRQTSLPKPILMESPSRSPTVMDANKAFHFPPSSRAERLDPLTDLETSKAASPTHHLGTAEATAGTHSDGLRDSAYLRGLRHSSNSPLSELVQRLNTPIKGEHQSSSSLVYNTDMSDVRGEEDQLEARYNIPESMLDEEEGASNIEYGYVEDSSGISAVPPSRLPQHLLLQAGPNTARARQYMQTFERSSGQKVSQDHTPSTRNSVTTLGHLRNTENRISPQTEKRWSMAEVEAAYARIRTLATRRSSAAASEAPSFLVSEDSKDFAPSYVQHLLDRGFPLDASITSSGSSRVPSGPSSHIGRLAAGQADSLTRESDLSNSTDREEEEDALTPLVGGDRYSLANTDSRVSPVALSPRISEYPIGSPRDNLVEASSDSPHSVSTNSSSRGKSNASATLTAPTTARHSQESVANLPHTAPWILRSAPDQNERCMKSIKGNTCSRQASGEGSSAISSDTASDDTGWVTPKTSIGDTLTRTWSISPGLTATRRGSSASAFEHYDEAPHHTTITPNSNARRANSSKIRRPVSYSSSGGTDSVLENQYGHNNCYRYMNGPSHRASNSSLWYDDTPKAISKIRPSNSTDFRGSMASHPHIRQASAYSTSGSTFSLDSFTTSSFAEAKRADKIDLFLRCTKAEAALQAITAHSQIEREALLDALQESRSMIDALRQQNEELIAELDHMRRVGSRKPAEQAQEAARRIAEIVEARDEWQARAQAMQRDLAAAKHAQQETKMDHQATLTAMRQEIARLQGQLILARPPRSPPKTVTRAASGLPRRSSPGGNPLKISVSPSSLPRSTHALKSSNNGITRSRRYSGTNSNGFSPHGRTSSNASSATQTDCEGYVPALSDGCSPADSQDASLRLDDSTARFLQDIGEHSVHARQRSTMRVK